MPIIPPGPTETLQGKRVVGSGQFRPRERERILEVILVVLTRLQAHIRERDSIGYIIIPSAQHTARDRSVGKPWQRHRTVRRSWTYAVGREYILKKPKGESGDKSAATRRRPPACRTDFLVGGACCVAPEKSRIFSRMPLTQLQEAAQQMFRRDLFWCCAMHTQ
jgi:hypothetical protein